MWMAKIVCPKCLQSHLYCWKGENQPVKEEQYTSYCPTSFMPFYIQGASSTLYKFKENLIEQAEITWEEGDPGSAPCLELKKWEPAKVVEID